MNIADLGKVKLTVYLPNVNLYGVNLQVINLSGANLSGANLNEAFMQGYTLFLDS